MPLAIRWILACILFAAPITARAYDGYLSLSEMPVITSWLPAMPQPGSPGDVRDQGSYFLMRGLVGAPRGSEAVADNVYLPNEVAPRFVEALGVTLTDSNASAVLTVIGRTQKDSEELLKPVKKPVKQGGRVRPYVVNPHEPACPHEKDDSQFHLNESGAYPSGHATTGMIWGLILAELAPDRADAVMAKGLSFGESREVCGFHWASDIDAGRVAAAVLVARLHADKAFLDDMVTAKAQLSALRRVGQPMPATKKRAPS